MFKQQTMEVELTNKNAAVLKKPSKIFNKIKSMFSGDMTPTEAAQSEIMLSILQRLNISLKKSTINNLAIVKVNEKIVYNDEQAITKNDIDVGEMRVNKGFELLDFQRLDSIEIVAQGIIGAIKYIVHAEVLRKPKKGRSPIQLKVTGLIDELSLQDGEGQAMLETRVKHYMGKKYGTKDRAKTENALFEAGFASFIAGFEAEIKRNFPGGLHLNERKTYRGIAAHKHASLYSSGDTNEGDFDYFTGSLLYLSFTDLAFSELISDIDSKSLSDELGWEGPDNFSDDTFADAGEGDNSWFSSIDSSDNNYSSCSSCSSCGGD